MKPRGHTMLKTRRNTLGYVYFLLDERRDHLKIGFATDFKRRLKSYRQVNPDLEVILVVKASFEFEQFLHNHLEKHLAKDRGREWYNLTEELAEAVTLVRWFSHTGRTRTYVTGAFA